jgi:hypothetical protein
MKYTHTLPRLYSVSNENNAQSKSETHKHDVVHPARAMKYTHTQCLAYTRERTFTQSRMEKNTHSVAHSTQHTDCFFAGCTQRVIHAERYMRRSIDAWTCVGPFCARHLNAKKWQSPGKWLWSPRLTMIFSLIGGDGSIENKSKKMWNVFERVVLQKYHQNSEITSKKFEIGFVYLKWHILRVWLVMYTLPRGGAVYRCC